MMKAMLPALGLLALAACAKTVQESGSSSPPPSGFLTNYSNLQPGKEGQLSLRYLNPNVNWSRYTAIYLQPVEFRAPKDSAISPSDQQMLTDYFYKTLKEHASAQLPVVDGPGANVITVRCALTDASKATPGLRTISVVVPQARLLNGIQSLGTGGYAFVGSAQFEMEALDGETGDELAAGVDQRAGGIALSNAGVWQWGDAENVMDYWSETMAKRLGQLRAGQELTMR